MEMFVFVVGFTMLFIQTYGFPKVLESFRRTFLAQYIALVAKANKNGTRARHPPTSTMIHEIHEEHTLIVLPGGTRGNQALVPSWPDEERRTNHQADKWKRVDANGSWTHKEIILFILGRTCKGNARQK